MQNKYSTVTQIAWITLASVFSVDVSAINRDANAIISDAKIMDELLDMDLEDLMKVQIVTIATGAKQTVTKAPATTTVITAEEIEAMGANDLDEVLETVPGLHIARSPNVFYRPLYIIRGIYSEVNPEVLMLINGIPITSIYGGDRGYGWGGMPVNAISRVEVIRGPGSAIYGADAFAGVINVITKTKEDIEGTEFGVRAGSFDTYDGWVLHGGSWKGFDIAASLEYHTTEGHQSIIDADAQTHYDKMFNTHASLAPGPMHTGTDNIDARVDVKKGLWQVRAGYQNRDHIGLGIGAAQALDPVGYVDSYRTNADLTYHNPTLTQYWDVTAQLNYFQGMFDTFNVFYPPGAFGGDYPEGYSFGEAVSERHTRLDLSAFYTRFQGHLIRLGVGYQQQEQYEVTERRNHGPDPATGEELPPGNPLIDATNTRYTYDQEARRDNEYLFIQDVWTINDQWELTAGVRYDNYSDFGSTINPRLALVWQATPDFTTKILYGQAFRAPTFVDLYLGNNTFSVGNPNIKPEQIDTWELAFDYRVTQNLHMATHLFKYNITDKILLEPSPGGKALNDFQNMGHWTGEGLELETRWKITDKLGLQANYSYAKGINEDSHNDIGNYPRHSASAHLNWLATSDWLADMQANWIAERHRIVGDPRPPIADYTTVDLTVRHKNILGKSANLTLGIRNLFDADAREPSRGPNSRGIINIPNDLPLPKRNIFVEFRYKF